VLHISGTLYSNLFSFGHQTWGIIILVYCIAASLVPVWALLQPRGYLGGFVLYSAIAVGIIGIFFGGYTIQQPAFKSFDVGGMTGMLFPFLFVTIACGACSGFHGLVCSGTTSKQLERESHAHPIGYGAMLAEGFVAFMALVVVMIAANDMLYGPDGKSFAAGKIYGNGIGEFLTLIVGKDNLQFAITFGAMAFSTFVFDTLDVAMRLGRYLVQELIGIPGKFGAIIGTLVTVALPFFLIFYAKPGSWVEFWTLFGASNQLLAALTLLSITAWLYKARKRIAFTLIPMMFILVITLWALSLLVIGNFQASTGFDIKLVNGIASLVLILLAIYLVITAWVKLRREPPSMLEPEITA
jgi:carbon starvation protein